MFENLCSLGLPCQMRRLDLASRATLYRFAVLGPEFKRWPPTTSAEFCGTETRCGFRIPRSYFANFDQLLATPQ
eukprot:3756188-Pyramimonas_sp.AAC.1